MNARYAACSSGVSTPDEAEALHTLGLCHYYQGEPRLALGELEQGLELARELGQRLLEVRITNSLALVHQRLADSLPLSIRDHGQRGEAQCVPFRMLWFNGYG